MRTIEIAVRKVETLECKRDAWRTPYYNSKTKFKKKLMQCSFYFGVSKFQFVKDVLFLDVYYYFS